MSKAVDNVSAHCDMQSLSQSVYRYGGLEYCANRFSSFSWHFDDKLSTLGCDPVKSHKAGKAMTRIAIAPWITVVFMMYIFLHMRGCVGKRMRTCPSLEGVCQSRASLALFSSFNGAHGERQAGALFLLLLLLLLLPLLVLGGAHYGKGARDPGHSGETRNDVLSVCTMQSYLIDHVDVSVYFVCPNTARSGEVRIA